MVSRRRATKVALVAVAAVVASAGCVVDGGNDPSSAFGTPSTGSSAAPTPTSALATIALARLQVTEPNRGLAPYRRAAFATGWDYDPRTGCNTRERVLLDESRTAAAVGPRCKILSGDWRSLYDGAAVTDPRRLQIDHVVPLADAWRSGAAGWPPARRHVFANDLTHGTTLIAVTGASNESKGDSTPDQWRPPDRRAWCRYATDWISVKTTWRLTVTRPERDALADLLHTCP